MSYKIIILKDEINSKVEDYKRDIKRSSDGDSIETHIVNNYEELISNMEDCDLVMLERLSDIDINELKKYDKRICICNYKEAKELEVETYLDIIESLIKGELINQT